MVTMRRLLALMLALVLPCGMLFSQKKDLYRVQTVVIDAGHGGAKPGAQGRKSQEKAITLEVAKKFGKLIEDNYPDVKVIYTRTGDVDISLAERAHIANRNKADLFISIHANSHPTSSPTGVETFVMGLSESRANLEVARKENADILLEADYKNNSDYQGFDPNAPETYVMLTMYQNAFIDKSLNLAQAIQNQYRQDLKTINRGVKQAELYVLYKTTCPSVLTEIGFISNPKEEAFMLSDEGQAKIAVCLFLAFMNYKATEEGTDRIANPVINLKGWQQQPAQEETQPATSDTTRTAAAEESAAPVTNTADKPTPSVQLPAVQQPTQPASPAPAATPATTTQNTQKVSYRVQFCSATRLLQAGDPDLHGIRDFQVARSGKYYMYTAGNYATLAQARERCKKIQESTNFKDAFVVAIYRGERITLERAAQIERNGR